MKIDLKNKILLDAACVFFIFCMSAVYFNPVWKQDKVFLPADLVFSMSPWIYYASENGVKVEGNMVFPHNMIPTDVVHHQYPYRKYFSDRLNKGEVSLWNPYVFCGAPFNANDQSALIYPFNFFFYKFIKDPAWAYTYLAWFHLFLGGVFMFMLMRFEGAGRFGGCAAAAVFMFNGCSVGWMQWAVFQAAGMWLPLALLLAGIALKRRSAAAILFCGVAIGVMLMSGLLQYASFTLFALALYLAYHILLRIRDIHLVKTAVAAGAVAVASGLALAAAHVWPAMSLAGDTIRPVRNMAGGIYRTALSFSNAVNVVLPDFYGNPVDHNLTLPPGPPYNAVVFYVPAVALLLCLLATATLFMRRRFELRRRVAAGFYVFLMIFAFLAMFGTPVYAIYYYLVPGAKTMKVSRIGYLFTFAASALTGLGLSALILWIKTPFIRDKAAGAGAASKVAKKGKKKKETKKEKKLRQEQERRAAAAKRPAHGGAQTVNVSKIVAVVVLATLCGYLLPWAMKLSTFFPEEMLYPAVPEIEFLQKQEGRFRIFSGDQAMVIFPNTAMALGLYDVRGYDSIFPGRYANFMDGILEQTSSPAQRRAKTIAEAPMVLASPVLDWMNVEYIYNSFQADNVAWYERIPVKNGFMYRNKRAYPRAFFSAGFRVEKDDGKTLAAVMAKEYRPQDEIVVDQQPEYPEMPDYGSDLGDEPVYRVEKWEPEEIVLRIRSPKDALLFFSETYYPGWKATLDKTPVEILRASYTFRAVPAPKGEYKLRMWYAPEDTRKGFNISFITMFLITGALLILKFTSAGPGMERFLKGIKPEPMVCVEAGEGADVEASESNPK